MKKKAWQYSKLDKHVSKRFKKLGDLGESLAEQLLKENGFTNVKNLNIEENKNVKTFDIYAERKKQKYVISVKARNKYENSKAGPRLNSRYKLCDDPNEFENEARKKYNSNSAWVTIAVEIDKGIFVSLCNFDSNGIDLPHILIKSGEGYAKPTNSAIFAKVRYPANHRIYILIVNTVFNHKRG